MTPTSEKILQEAFENPTCDGCWGRLQTLIEELEQQVREAKAETLNLRVMSGVKE